jgi:outer membrane protein TolC
MSVRNLTTYDAHNQLSNAIGASAFEQYIESEIRQPLLQGAGTEFNRIAGPGARPGQINGFLIGRVRTDISITDFERAVRDLVADVENAYWDLHFAFRDLEAKVDARDIALVTAKKLEAQAATQGTGDAAQAMEQYYRFESDVIDSVNGRPVDGTRVNNGSSGGTFRGTGGLRVSERRLRLILGMTINDGKLIRTTDEPTEAPVLYDWDSSSGEAVLQREEVRRQRWVVKQRELELIANRNFLKPQLDVIGRYRFRGFGKDLLNYEGKSNAVSNLMDGDYQEWQAGIEYTLPVGFRKAFTAVRNSELGLRRDIEILKEQERVVLYGLSNAMNEMKRSFDSMQVQEKRLGEIVRQLNSLQAKWESGQDPALDVLLETHRRLLDARLRYHQSRIEYVLAIRNVEFEKGSLLEFCNVNLAR